MTILVTGATGTVGSLVLKKLATLNVAVRALTRDPGRAVVPKGVTVVQGDMLDVASMKTALEGVTTLFLLNSVCADELTQALLTLKLAKEAGVSGLVYLSVFGGDRISDVPHYAAKCASELVIARCDLPATVLRPNCFIQNDARLASTILQTGVYEFPVGDVGVSMVDVRDIAQVAADALLRRARSGTTLPREIINVVGPEALTGSRIAEIWSRLTRKPVRYAGLQTRLFEAHMARHAPNWLAMDMRLMLDRFQTGDMKASSQDVEAMAARLGRPPRTYAAFAAELLAQQALTSSC